MERNWGLYKVISIKCLNHNSMIILQIFWLTFRNYDSPISSNNKKYVASPIYQISRKWSGLYLPYYNITGPFLLMRRISEFDVIYFLYNRPNMIHILKFGKKVLHDRTLYLNIIIINIGEFCIWRGICGVKRKYYLSFSIAKAFINSDTCTCKLDEHKIAYIIYSIFINNPY